MGVGWRLVAAAPVPLLAGACLALAFEVEGSRLRLPWGREIELVDGRLKGEQVRELHREAEAFFVGGRLDLAREAGEALARYGGEHAATPARQLLERIAAVEYSSLIRLVRGEVHRGKLLTPLRADLLGLEGKEEIPLGRVAEISAGYHLGFSAVTRTFYPLTFLEVRFRDGTVARGQVTGEVEIVLESSDGAIQRFTLGRAYELLREDGLVRSLGEENAHRVTSIIVYSALPEPGP